MDGEGAGQYPLLVFPAKERGERQDRHGRPSQLRLPTRGRQNERLGPQFRVLQERFNAAIQSAAQGIDVDLVLVMEIAGSVADFVKAAIKVDGLEWIGEWESDDIDPDLDFATNREGERVAGNLFLMFSNQRAMQQLLTLWQRFQERPDDSWPRGLTKWRDVFDHLREIRHWDERDRIAPELLKDWEERLEYGQETVPFEAELWFYQNPDKRRLAEADLRRKIEASGGRVTGQCTIQEIEFQALVGELPAASVHNLQADHNVQLFKSSEVMYVRPVAQTLVTSDTTGTMASNNTEERPLPDRGKDAVVAVLDGLPVESHPLLTNRLLVDDPDGLAAVVPAADRIHGTAMASLIVHGDLESAGSSLPRRIYVRPILVPDQAQWKGSRRERVPDGVTFPDIVNRAVTRLFQSTPPGVGRIYAINLSVGDSLRMFLRSMSPCARLLDWLSWKYNVLFLVSAGNHMAKISVDQPRDFLEAATPEQVAHAVLRGLERDGANRRLLSPSEAVNALTIGAVASDASVPTSIQRTTLAYADPLPSPYNAQGFGYRRAAKPDVLFPGGRVLLREALAPPAGTTQVEMVGMTRPPGHRVAAPPTAALAPREMHLAGTSNACALATRNAAHLYEILTDRRAMDGVVPAEYVSVVMKTLTVHGARWDGLGERYEAALNANPTVFPRFVDRREYIAKYLGNGIGDFDRSVRCNARRVTLIGYGSLADGAADVYAFPLPQALIGRRGLRRLVVTLSWFSPINSRHRNYRRAQLWFNFPDKGSQPELVVPSTRAEVRHRTAQRGTVQHEVFVGEDARVFQVDAGLRVWVNCKADAGNLEGEAPYCLAVSMEVGEELDLPIYQQVAQRVRQAVQVRPLTT